MKEKWEEQFDNFTTNEGRKNYVRKLVRINVEKEREKLLNWIKGMSWDPKNRTPDAVRLLSEISGLLNK